jgi:hypothetical protein
MPSMLRLRKLDSRPGNSHEEGLRLRIPGITAASASGPQEVSLYVATSEGAYRFDPRRHRRLPIPSEGVRTLDIAPDEPLIPRDALIQLVFVVDIGFEESALAERPVERLYGRADTGTIAANLYLFAASRGLACWIHDCDRVALAKRLGLGRSQRVLFVQTIGLPVQWRDDAGPHARPTLPAQPP